MAEMSWEKPVATLGAKSVVSGDRLKFMVGGVLLLGAVVYLIVFGTVSGAQYFMTVDSLLASDEYVGQTVRISGAVLGDTIVYDGSSLMLDFTIVHIPTETEDLALTLYNAVNDPNGARLPVHMEGEVKPDLLVNEAQAILTGTLGADGVFQATELLLKCPSRYEEDVPAQVSGGV